MKILFITHQLSNETVKTNFYTNNTISDMVLHGLKNVYGDDVIDHPGAWYMFKDEVKKKSFDGTIPSLEPSPWFRNSWLQQNSRRRAEKK